MKNRIKIKLTAITLVICMLLSGSLMPIWAADSLTKESTATESKVQESIIPAEDIALEQVDLLSKEDSALWNYIDLDSIHAEKHTARLETLEEPDTFVFQNSDGTRTTYFMEEDVKYIDSNGSTVIKDITLAKKETGFGITRNNVELLIPNNLKSGVDVGYADYSIKLIPQNTASNILPEQKNNAVRYNGVFGAKTTLVYTPTLSGIKEDIILSEYIENASYTFILETDGLTLQNRDGKYVLCNGLQRDPVFYLGEILVYDAIGKPDMGTMTVETIEEGQEYLLTVSASDDFLSDPDTVYPVTIDPSISISDSETSGDIEDAVIFENRPNENFGNYVYNRVGTPSASYGVGRTVVRLRGLLDSDEWAELHPYNVESLYFYATEATGSGSQTIMIYPLYNNTTWTESTVTWNDIGNVGWYTSYDATMSYNQEAAFNITSFATQWKYGDLPAEAGFIMLNSNETLDKSFCSSEYSNSTLRPRVVMTYTPMEGGNNFANATSLSAGGYVPVNLMSASDKKYFKFVPSTTGFYTIQSFENTADPYVRLYNSTQQTITYDNDSAGYSNFRLTYHLVKNATYYFEIGCSSSGAGLFTFTLSSATDASNISATTMNFDSLSYAVENPAPFIPTIYQFTPVSSAEYLFYTCVSFTDPVIWLYNSNMSLIGENDNGAGNDNFRLSVNLTAGQTYYIVAGHNDVGDSYYSIALLMEATIPYDVYSFANAETNLYIDIEGPGAQEWVQQWSWHTGLQEDWYINKETDGYYTIRSEYGSKKYVGISSSSTNVDNIKLYSNVSDITKWKIYQNASYELILEPKTAEGKVLAAPNNTVGAQLQLRDIFVDTDLHRSGWMLNLYTLTVNPFYDIAFSVRYTGAQSIISGFSNELSRVLHGTVGLRLVMNSPTMIASTPDNCKLQRGLSITSTTIDDPLLAICPANPSKGGTCSYYNAHKEGDSYCENCTSWDQIYRDFINEYPGNETTISALFTGNRLYNDLGVECNRSFRWYHNGIILQEIYANSSEYASEMLSCLLHEISHEIGAPDHYHEWYTNDQGETVCRGGDLCFECNSSTGRPKWCSMGDYGCWRDDLATCDIDEVYCEGCRNEIIAHLTKHH